MRGPFTLVRTASLVIFVVNCMIGGFSFAQSDLQSMIDKALERNLPALDIKCVYTAETLEDFTDCSRRTALLAMAFYNRGSGKGLIEKSYTPGSTIAKAVIHYVGNPKRYMATVERSGYKPWNFNFDIFYDGKIYLYRTNPGDYASVQAEWQWPVSPFYDVLERIPSDVPDFPMAVAKNGTLSMREFLITALKAKDCKIVGDATDLTISATTNPRKHADSELIQDEVVVKLKLLPHFELERVEVTPTKVTGGKTFKYGPSIVEYSNYKIIEDIAIPSRVVFTSCVKLADFGGRSNIEISKILGIPEVNVENKIYRVISHVYSVDSVAIFNSVSDVGIELKEGERVLNRFTDDVTILPKGIKVTNIDDFLSTTQK